MALSLSPQEIVERNEHPLLRISTVWERVRLDDIATVQNGFPFESSLFSVEGGFPLIRIRDVARGETQHYYTGEYEEEFIVRRGDILIGMDGDFRAARWRGADALLNQRVCRLKVETESYDEDFLLLCLQPYLDAVNAETSSVTVKHLSSKTVQDLPLPLPPLNEQRRIVEKIEAMFDEISKGVESLQMARATLGLYRQSLLKSAFEGRLTADWRVQNADKLEPPETLFARIQAERDACYKAALNTWQDALAKWRADGEKGTKPAKPKRPKDFSGLAKTPPGVSVPIPAEWLLPAMSDLGQTTGGLTKNQKRNSLPLKVKYLRVANVYSNRLELDEIMEIGVTEEELLKTSLVTGDLLFVEGNGSIEQIGRVAIWDGSIPNMTHQNHLIRFSADGILSSRFALYFMISPVGRKLIEAQASSTSGLHTLSISKIEGLPVPVCSPHEQSEIVRILDEKLEAADVLEAEIDAALIRAEALRQSILKKAFSGQLVPQDPDDEPASALLERIKAEKAERHQAAKRDRKFAPPRKPKARRPTLTDLIGVLEKQKSWVSAAKAAQELGIGDGSTSDEVEAFYRQLKGFVEDGAIEVDRRGEEDWLRLAKAEVT